MTTERSGDSSIPLLVAVECACYVTVVNQSLDQSGVVYVINNNIGMQPIHIDMWKRDGYCADKAPYVRTGLCCVQAGGCGHNLKTDSSRRVPLWRITFSQSLVIWMLSLIKERGRYAENVSTRMLE